jgi:hypothetical protein
VIPVQLGTFCSITKIPDLIFSGGDNDRVDRIVEEKKRE